MFIKLNWYVRNKHKQLKEKKKTIYAEYLKMWVKLFRTVSFTYTSYYELHRS